MGSRLLAYRACELQVDYSLIESAELAGVEPPAYIPEAVRRAIESPATIPVWSNLCVR